MTENKNNIKVDKKTDISEDINMDFKAGVNKNIKTDIKTFRRAFELDALRGLSVIMMILHHLIYDLRYIIGLDVFAWQDSYFFIDWVRAPFVFIFLFVSGICCSFSRNNFIRAAKMAAAALLFSIVFYIVSIVLDSEMYVFFNVLHLLTFGTFLYAVLAWLEKRFSFRWGNAVLILLGILFLWMSYPLSNISASHIPALIPLSEQFALGVGMADYMPLVPWFGIFLFGALFGRLYYKEKESLCLLCPAIIVNILKPFGFVGRNAMLFYLFHQPIIIGALYLFQFLGIIGK